MECPRVCVIDNSASIRETISIILADAYRVQCLTPAACLREPSQLADSDLLIVGDDAFPPSFAAALLQGPPILWLQARRGFLPPTGGRSAALSRSFTPAQLQAQVEALLAAPEPAQPLLSGGSLIEYPLLPKEATLLARRAASTQLPVLICGEPGTGKARLARAIHSLTREGRFVSLATASCTRAALQQAGDIAPGHLTVFVSDVHGVGTDGQQLLLELLDCGGFASDAGWHSVRFVCATAHTFEALARADGLDKELFYRLSVLPIMLPPLRERAHDIPALVGELTQRLTRALSLEPVSFTKRAMERLAHYLWFGNLAELETVLTRTVALAQNREIDAEDLLFGYGRVVPRGRDLDGTPRPASTTPASADTVDLIINELAHEFKNPMVTIKTIAHQLERLVTDEAGRQQVARLTGEAVDRMDRALENLLQFTRFRTPAPEDISLNVLLAPCLTDVTPALTERRVVLKYQPPSPAPVFVDPEQVTYALENLLRTVVRDLEEGQTLSIHPAGGPATIVVEFKHTSQPLATKLTKFLDAPHHNGEPALPLGLVFAKALIERNGGHLDLGRSAEKAAITIRLPSREGTAAGNGKTARPRS